MASKPDPIKTAVLILGIAALLGIVGFVWKPVSEARAYRESIGVVFRELDRMEAERHRIAGVAPPVTRYANLHTQVELETLEAKQNAVANAITKQIQDHFLNVQALSALEAQERKISELRMEFETKRKERLERFASAPVQKGCRWIECPEPFSLPGEAMLIKMRAENPNFDHPTEKVGKSKHR